ncbi:MAG: TfuA-related McrA-glycine thioamidation protein [Methanoregulaceae archaeon]
MPGTTVVFLGPSLDRESAGKILPADYRPPVKRGDILQAVEDGACVIGIIDGVFFQDCAVGHREILSALRKGIAVVGSSSMGALRAAELDAHGMVGIGEIYRKFKVQELESDDEVALIYDPESFILLSEPLVNIRHNLRRAAERGIIGRSTEEILLRETHRIYFPQRTYRKICSAAKGTGTVPGEEVDRFLAFVESEGEDLKRRDAIHALEYIRDLENL